MKSNNSNFTSRTKIFSLCLLFFAFILISKLFLVSVVHGKSYSSIANRQYVTPSSNISERGSIFFERKDGELVSAAMQAVGFKVTIDPSQIVNDIEAYEKLSTIIEIDRDEFLIKAGKKKDPYEEIINKITKEQADKVGALKISGVKISEEKWRFYPGGNLASHTLGFVAYEGDELGGRYGIEREYENVLSRDKDNPYVNFFAEVFSNLNKSLFEKEIKKGDIITTIEPNVENFLENELELVREKYQADAIGGIIINPMDGSIYAISSKPDFDLNNFSKVKDASSFSNPMIENVLEFGSVVKPLVMAAALDTGVVNANTSYNDTGSVMIEKKEIFNFDKKDRGPGTTMQDVLSQSLNTGMVYVYQQLGKKNMHDYMLSYGIKEKTGIDLPNETSGLVSNLTANLNNKREIEYANVAFGQGIALTPIEMVRALASLSNGGNLVVPHVVDRIKYQSGKEEKIIYPTSKTKISEQTAEEITRMLVTVMDKSLKGGLAKFEHHSVAVKTGTAQVADNVGGGYYEDRHTHSFFGYFPAYDPKFIVFLYAVNPKGVPYASVTWADPFLNITKFLLNYYEVPPDR
ncbi:MAG: stage V sporulation protein D [Candidatus Nomurabacteria bacterium GW2011_GWA2_40_9]|uniref:Stage V sporulation protein D n=1 Tax=Candidatus Nomurabacteria bacterium GW2011_GWA2_40_9 TaxID=1618734 RepID=A0A0G0TYE8_9BACT|nr:MAG: stage V sporulation protein D [Candidatus Nomurabacteria bacterium GW2011_GWA2_40_9]